MMGNNETSLHSESPVDDLIMGCKKGKKDVVESSLEIMRTNPIFYENLSKRVKV